MRSTRRLPALLVLGLLYGSGTLASAWGPEPHKAIGRIAESLLSDDASREAHALLKGTALADVANCADEVRSLERNAPGFAMSPPCLTLFPQVIPGTAPWHYINIDVAIAQPTPAQIREACHGSCVVERIEHFSGVLKDRASPPSDRAQALAFLVHFVGDLHMPLHACDRHGDRGGNAVFVNFFDSPHVTLHWVWDALLPARLSKDADGLVPLLAPDVAKARLEKGPTDVWDRAALWARESLTAAREVVYPGVPEEGVTTLGDEYTDRALPVVRTRLAQASVRLATLLNEILVPPPQAKAPRR